MSNSVSKPSAKYTEYESEWQKCRDAIAGQRKVRERGEEYLPRFSGQDDEGYKRFLQQALFYNATGRTYSGYKGMIFRKAPDINADSIEDFVNDCTLSGKSLAEFSELAIEEELTTSRFGILVDHPKTEGSNLSQAEAEQRGNRPYFVAYRAEDILEVKTDRVGNKTKLIQVRLQEKVSAPTDDEFEDKKIEQIRVLDLERTDSGVRYRQRVFRQQSKDGKDGGKWEEVLEMRQYPKMNGQFIDEIPFFMIGGYEFREPFLIDLVNVNLLHYMKEADHSAGVSRTTRPQYYSTGVTDDDLPQNLILGGEQFWNFPPAEANVGILSLDSDLVASSKYLEKLEEMMANLGARMLMPENTSEETATEYVIKKEGENSALSNVSKLVSECLTQATQFAAQWMGVASFEDITIKLNTDFIPFRATPDDLLKMISAIQSGRYTMGDYLWWLQEAEMVDPSVENEERKAQLETEPPPGMGGNQNSNQNGV